MNYSELATIIERMNFDLDRARVEQISDGNHRLQMGFRTPNIDEARRFFVIIDFKSNHLDVYATAHPQKAPATPQAFTMLLRKYALNLCVCSVRIAHDDRIVFFDFGYNDEPLYSLIAELTGKTPNLFFIETSSQKILGRVGRDAPRNPALALENEATSNFKQATSVSKPSTAREINTPYARPVPPPTGLASSNRFQHLSQKEFYANIEAIIRERDKTEAFQNAKINAVSRVRKNLKRLEKLRQSLSVDLQKVEQAQNKLKEADLLNAYAWKIQKGDKSVVLPDFETGKDVVVTLDPSITLRDNIEKRYAQSKRMKKAEPQIRARFDENNQKLEKIRPLLEKMESADTIDELEEALQDLDLCDALDSWDSPKSASSSATQKRGKAQHKPFKIFYAADATPILVGKSAKDNIELTFKYTRGNDTWLHACGVTGSHVVIKSANPKPETILDAALLAMHYSSFAKSASAEIQVTQVKYLKKIKSGPIGKIEVHGERALHIRRDDDRLKRLLGTLQT